MIDRYWLDDLVADAHRIIEDPSDTNNAVELAENLIKLATLLYTDLSKKDEYPNCSGTIKGYHGT